MHGNGSGSAISRHQLLAEMPKDKVSMTSLHWQTSLQTQTGHASLHRWRLLTQFHNWSMRSTPEHVCVTVDWVTLIISESAHMVHRPTRVGTVGSCVAFERDSPGAFGVFFIFFSPGRTLKQCRTHQGWLNVRMVGTVRSHSYWVGPGGANQLFMAWMVPGGGLGCSSCMRWRSHVISTCLDHLLGGV